MKAGEERSLPLTIRIFLAAVPWLVVAGIFYFAFTGDWFRTWHAVRVTPLHIPFLDLQGFPTGLEVYRHGGDPLIANPLDPWQRPLNYPHLMMFLFMALGISAKNLVFFGVMLAAAYLACVTTLILRARGAVEAIVLLVVSLSPVPLLAIALGNTDVLIFSLVFLAFLLRRSLFGPIVLFAATLLKIYPFAALVIYSVFPPAKFKKLPMLLAMLALFVFAWRWREMDAIRRDTPISPIVSFGVLAIRNSMNFAMRDHGYSIRQSFIAGWAAVFFCWAAGLAALIKGWLKPSSRVTSTGQSDASQLFCLYAAIYVFSFAVGSNFDYRLIYLIPMIPFSLELARSRKDLLGRFLLTGCLLFALNWLNTEYGAVLVLAHFVTFTIFLLTLGVLGEQLKSYFGQPIREALREPPVLESSRLPVA
jgi:hypothetical protein